MYTLEQYQKLCDAIALGAYEVQYGDKRVVYRSLDEMLRLKDSMERSLGVVQRAQRKFPVASKGTI